MRGSWARKQAGAFGGGKGGVSEEGESRAGRPGPGKAASEGSDGVCSGSSSVRDVAEDPSDGSMGARSRTVEAEEGEDPGGPLSSSGGVGASTVGGSEDGPPPRSSSSSSDVKEAQDELMDWMP